MTAAVCTDCARKASLGARKASLGGRKASLGGRLCCLGCSHVVVRKADPR